MASFGGFLGRLLQLIGLSDRIERQFGAVPYRQGENGLEFLLITSRRTGRWIFPKGGRMLMLSGADSAAEEAWEEAGVRGQIDVEPAGFYRDRKVRDGGEVVIEVEMFPMAVNEEFDDWPEKGQRRRRWAGREGAAILLSHPELVEMVHAIAVREEKAEQKS